MSRLNLGDRIRIIDARNPSGEVIERFIGATGVVICRDSRPYYGSYWEVWPDDETLCNPGPNYRAWCIKDNAKEVEIVSHASIEELLTSERRDWREYGRVLLKRSRRFGLIRRILGV